MKKDKNKMNNFEFYVNADGNICVKIESTMDEPYTAIKELNEEQVKFINNITINWLSEKQNKTK